MKKIVAVLVLFLAVAWVIIWVGSLYEPSWKETAETLQKVLVWLIGALAVVLAAFALQGSKVP